MQPVFQNHTEYYEWANKNYELARLNNLLHFDGEHYWALTLEQFQEIENTSGFIQIPISQPTPITNNQK